MKQVRICWLPSAVYNVADPDNRVSCSGWEAETRGKSIDIRFLCDAANKLYGPGSHWIERREVLAVQDLLAEMEAPCSRTAPQPSPFPPSKPARANPSVPERLQSSEHWRLMFA